MFDLGEVKSLNDLPENVRGIFSEKEGKIFLDESKVRTVSDVQAVLDAKKHEVDDHNATKAKLDAWSKLGKTTEEIQSILDEYPALKESGKTNEDYLAEKKLRSQKERELKDITEKLGAAEKKIAELDAYRTEVLKQSQWNPISQKLKKNFDNAMVDLFYDDYKDKIKINDIGEFEQINGKSVEEFFTSRLTAFHAELKNTPGGTVNGDNKFSGKITQGFTPYIQGNEGFLDEEVIKQGNL